MNTREVITRASASSPDLFSNNPGFDENQEHKSGALEEAESELLALADYVYVHTSLKPISKTLFAISRCLLAVASDDRITGHGQLCEAYEAVRRTLGIAAPSDDFSFSVVIDECRPHLPKILSALYRIRQLTRGTDSLGLAFNTLLRGKWEGGEGLGTFLTPEEVVAPAVEMALSSVDERCLNGQSDGAYFGDICGGTGRFVYHVTRALLARGADPSVVGRARLFDQSSMAIDLARINFALEGLQARFECVGDSLVDPVVSSLRGEFCLLATNPPFGAGKYRWSQALESSLSSEILHSVGLTNGSSSADPSHLFLFRNLDLLTTGGVLAIVLPDGIAYSKTFKTSLLTYEAVRKCGIEILAVVSLPVATFALGGTVAKTSFLILKRVGTPSRSRLFVATARHVGFLKRGNKRVVDPRGNDLIPIAKEYASCHVEQAEFVENWRQHPAVSPQALLHRDRCLSGTVRPLGELVDLSRKPAVAPGDRGEAFHLSILDVDETGLINIVEAKRNRPQSPGSACRPGDILVSCLNPRIWRVTVVPNLPGTWSCSAEFAVLRPRVGVNAWKVALAMHHRSVRETLTARSSGTSSSRQRVPKSAVTSIQLPEIAAEEDLIAQHAESRCDYYRGRLLEARAYEALHGGEQLFRL